MAGLPQNSEQAFGMTTPQGGGSETYGAKPMTLVLAVRGNNGIVLAADSRGTYGDPRAITAQNDSMIKLHRLARHAGVLMAGDAGLGNQILATFPQDRAASVSISMLMEIFRHHIRTVYSSWFQGFAIQPVQGATQPTRPQVNFIVAGYDYDADGNANTPALYNLPCHYDFAPVRLDHGFVLDGVAQYGLYLFNRLYRDGYSMEQLKSLVAYAITETASQDGKVGGPIRMATISSQAGYQDVPDEDVNSLVEENGARSEALRRSFFGENP